MFQNRTNFMTSAKKWWLTVLLLSLLHYHNMKIFPVKNLNPDPKLSQALSITTHPTENMCGNFLGRSLIISLYKTSISFNTCFITAKRPGFNLHLGSFGYFLDGWIKNKNNYKENL